MRLSNGTPFTFETLTVVAVDAEDASVQLSGQPTSPFAACSGTKAAAHGGRPLVCLDKLEPGETDLLDVDVVAAHRVRTGTQRVGVILTGDRAVPGAASVPLSTPAATADVQLGVFGVDALTPFGIGTLFVLPGLLAVVTFLMLSRWLFPKSQKLPDTVALGDLRAMPFVAAGGALAYLIMFLVFGRNLTQRVSTGDVAELFVIGIVVGFAVWAVMAGIWQARIGRKQFSVEDSPEKVLKRLAAQNARLTLPVVAVNAMKYVFLARGRDNKPLAAPRIAYSFGNGASDQKRTEFRDALRAENPARVRELSREKVVSLGWQTAEGVIPLGADAAPSPDETLNLLLEGSDDEDGAG